MSLPPLNLLLPQQFTFKDYFTDYPLHITSPSITPVLTCLLTHHASNRSLEPDAPANTHKSLWLNCSISKDQLPDALTDPEAPFNAFFRGDATSKGKLLWSANQIDIIHISTLYELRAVLHALPHHSRLASASTSNLPVSEQVNDVADETREIPDSQESSHAHEDKDPSSSLFKPLLVISGFDVVHDLAGELSAQGISRTIAAAIDAAVIGYRLIVHSTLPIETDIALLNAGGQPVPGMDVPVKSTLKRVVQRYFGYDWVVPMTNDSGGSGGGGGGGIGYWKFLDQEKHGRGYTITWQYNQSGECMNVKMDRTPESQTE